MFIKFHIFFIFIVFFSKNIFSTSSKLDPVDDLKTCKTIPENHECQELCSKIQKAYEIRKTPVDLVPYYIAGGVLFVLVLANIIMAIQLCDSNSNDKKIDMQLRELMRLADEMEADQNPDHGVRNFRDQGNVKIATNLDEAFNQKCEDEDDVELGDVEYDENQNEKLEVGKELDKFESSRSPADRKSISSIQ